MKKINKAAENAVSLAKVKPEEKILIVTDPPTYEVGEALFKAAKKKAGQALLVLTEPTGQDSSEPPEEVSELMLEHDIIFAPTKYSLTHTNAVRSVSKKGGRVGTLPGITRELFKRGLTADYQKIQEINNKLKKEYDKADWTKVKANGTDIRIPIHGREALTMDAELDKKGVITNLPDGECGLSPPEGKTSGFFTAKDTNYSGKTVKFVVDKGKVQDVEGSKKLKEKLWSTENARNIAEFSIGTNPNARLSGNILEDEKVLGTCHIAVGDSQSMGGEIEAPIHWDFVILEPSIWFDEKKVMEKGKLLV